MKVKEYEARVAPSGLAYLAETGAYNADGRRVYRSPDMLVSFFEEIGLRQKADEYVYCACLDTGLHLIGCFEASHGSANTACFPIREILQKALLLGAVGIAICHNHPSGCLTPSGHDADATRNIMDACGVVGIGFIDHIILPANSCAYYSFSEQGQIVAGKEEKEEK